MEESEVMSTNLPHSKDDDWVDVLGSGELLVKTVKVGDSNDIRPDANDSVVVNIGCKNEDGETVSSECCQQFQFFIGHNEVVQAVDLAIRSVNAGALCEIETSARFAYGGVGKHPDILPNAKLFYTVDLLSVDPPVEVMDIAHDERLRIVYRKKERGNFFHQRGEFESAVQQYKKALEYLRIPFNAGNPMSAEQEASVDIVAAVLYNNLGQVQLKLGNLSDALMNVNHCLEIEPSNLKALFRKGRILKETGEYRDAIRCLEAAKAHDTSGHVTIVEQELRELKKLFFDSEMKDKQFYQNMFKKMELENETSTCRTSSTSVARAAWRKIRSSFALSAAVCSFGVATIGFGLSFYFKHSF